VPASSQFLIIVPNPAAAADWAYTVPAGYASGLILISASALLTCSATVANRQPALQCRSPNNTVLSAGINGALTASQLARYLFGMGLPALGAPVNSAVSPSTYPLPQGLYVPPGGTIQVVTAGLAAGDQWSDIVLGVAQ
jgi:hypothetical protein